MLDGCLKVLKGLEIGKRLLSGLESLRSGRHMHLSHLYYYFPHIAVAIVIVDNAWNSPLEIKIAIVTGPGKIVISLRDSTTISGSIKPQFRRC